MDEMDRKEGMGALSGWKGVTGLSEGFTALTDLVNSSSNYFVRKRNSQAEITKRMNSFVHPCAVHRRRVLDFTTAAPLRSSEG